MDKEDKYFINLLQKGYLPDDISVIKESFEESGLWEASDEWRISTETEFKICTAERYNKKCYRVEVMCDHKFICYCPSLEKAVEMAKLYQVMLVNMYHQLGWPSKIY